MRAVIVAIAPHQNVWAAAFAAGLKRHGIVADIRGATATCDLLVMWGIRNKRAIEEQKAHGGDVCILERGYLGDRFHWTSVSFGGGLNGRGQFRGVRDDPTRFEINFGHMMQPWQDRDGPALLIGQVPGDMSLEGHDIDQWYRDVAAALRGAGRKVLFRPHPLATERGFRPPKLDGVEIVGGRLSDVLTRCGTVITFNSNTGVESVLAGVPTMTADMGAMAWDVTTHDPHEKIMPPRERWAARLAWMQWTLDEMESGACWDRVKS